MNLDSDTDATLMQRYRDGELAAFELLYQRHKTALYRYLQRLCRDPDTANDVFQETWSKLIASRARYEVRAQFKTFLYSVARNAALDALRRTSRLQAHEWQEIGELSDSLPAATHEQPEMQVAEQQLRSDFQQTLEQLPAAQREAFLLFEEAGLNLHEIAAITGASMETAKSRLRYAVRKLRAALHHYQPAHAEPHQQEATS